MAKAKPESTVPGHKAAALAARSRLHPGTDYYYFIDYASMEQENLVDAQFTHAPHPRAALALPYETTFARLCPRCLPFTSPPPPLTQAALVESVCLLPLHIACCDEMVMYDSPSCLYERRAWTRIERMLAFCLQVTCQAKINL